MPPVTPDKLGDLEAMAAAVSDQPLLSAPGRLVSYSPIGAHAVLGELVRRLDGGSRPFRQILADEFFGPLAGSRLWCATAARASSCPSCSRP